MSGICLCLFVSVIFFSSHRVLIFPPKKEQVRIIQMTVSVILCVCYSMSEFQNLCICHWVCLCPLIRVSLRRGYPYVTLWVTVCLFLTGSFRESAFLCLRVFLSMCMFISTLLSEGKTPRPHPLLFMNGKNWVARLRDHMSAERRQEETEAWLQSLIDLSPSGGTRVFTLYRGHEGLAHRGSMAQKEEDCPWGKEASLMHCTG